MTQLWDNESRDALIKYRVGRADEALSEAQLLASQGYYNTAINRLYYACFYVSIALLLKENIQAQTHSGVKTMISLHFISKGIIPKEIGKNLNALFERRQSGDYDDFVLCDQNDVDELQEKALVYVEFVKSIILIYNFRINC